MFSSSFSLFFQNCEKMQLNFGPHSSIVHSKAGLGPHDHDKSIVLRFSLYMCNFVTWLSIQSPLF